MGVELACVRASVQGSVGGSGIASRIHTTSMLYSPLSSARSFACKPARNFMLVDHSLLALPPLPPLLLPPCSRRPLIARLP